MKRVVVTPVYEDAEASGRLFRELRASLGDKLFIVAVDDGSVREPVDVVSLAAANADGVVIRLRRNVGHQRAIAIGLSYVAREVEDVEYVIVMDSDGEDVPATITNLVIPLQSTDDDVVVAQRRSRVDALRIRIFYQFYKWLFHALSGREINFGNFMALKPPAVRRLAAMQELWVHVAASVLASKLRVTICPLDRGPRYAGRSKMSFVGLALHGFRGLMVFADDVLMRVGIASAIIAALAVIGGIVAVLLKLNGYATPGWFSVALGVLSIVFLQTGALTLMSLMLTGVVRSGSVATTDYREFIDEVLHVGAR
jgi:glycosyltransferase involved in cell wall biosynthesis